MQSCVPRASAGFTFVELVAVIMILSVLGAVALARFMDASEQAHETAAKGVSGGFSTAVNSVRGQWFADGQPATSVVFDDNSVPVTGSGWPTPVLGGTDCIDLWQDLMLNPPPIANFTPPYVAGEGWWAWTFQNATTSACFYIYRPTYPTKLMWFLYYGEVTTNPTFDGRIITAGF